jgi:hypothetical protein
MNRDDIIRMAQQAGMREGESGDWTTADAALTYPECVYTENLECFANLVAAAEREACAKVAEDMGNIDGNMNKTWRNGCFDVAFAIRERGAP